jgi:Leucine-rich repeat (LRR) protein
VGLEPLTSLEHLRLEYNYIVDITPLLPLTSLQSLDLLGNTELDCSSDAYNTLKTRVPDFISSCP